MAVTNINNAWKDDLYPLIDRVFEVEYKNRMGALRRIVSEVDSRSAEYRAEGVGGYGELPGYAGELRNMDQRRASSPSSARAEGRAIDIDYKYARIDKSGEARSAAAGRLIPPHERVYGRLRMFGSAFDETVLGGDG
jgi:hypothetical protein